MTKLSRRGALMVLVVVCGCGNTAKKAFPPDAGVDTSADGAAIPDTGMAGASDGLSIRDAIADGAVDGLQLPYGANDAATEGPLPRDAGVDTAADNRLPVDTKVDLAADRATEARNTDSAPDGAGGKDSPEDTAPGRDGGRDSVVIISSDAGPSDGSVASGDASNMDAQNEAGGAVVERRLPLPCSAPLPTGFCLTSDVSGSTSVAAGGANSVTILENSFTTIILDLQNTNTSSEWEASFAAPAGGFLVPGLFDPATRYPFQTGAAAGLDVIGSCNTSTGRFAIEELARDPVQGITRFSATFEQYCDGSASALRGVINYQATGAPDPTPAPAQVINLDGNVFRVAYDATSHIAYGLDATNRRLAKIDLASGNVTYADVVQTPNDGCVDAKRGRLFVVNKGSTLITEYGSGDLATVRNIAWAGNDWSLTATHFKIYCAPDRLYVVDGAWAPGLSTVDGLDSANPQVTDHTSDLSGVGGLALNSTATDLYYWYQYGWNADISTYVRHLATADFSQIDDSGSSVASFTGDPLDTPIYLDETRALVFVKNKVFDATNLAVVMYTLPGSFDTLNGAVENTYALDPTHGLLATKRYVYELSRYQVVAPTLIPNATQLFFDKDGMLWLLTSGALKAQAIVR